MAAKFGPGIIPYLPERSPIGHLAGSSALHIPDALKGLNAGPVVSHEPFDATGLVLMVYQNGAPELGRRDKLTWIPTLPFVNELSTTDPESGVENGAMY